MGTLVIGTVAIVDVAFMAVFFMQICRESSRIKLCKVLRADTHPIANSDFSHSVDDVQSLQPLNSSKAAGLHAKVLTMPRRREAPGALRRVEQRKLG